MDRMRDDEFLSYMLGAASEGVLVSAEQVKRLKALAGWAETPIPAEWWGRIDYTETRRAVRMARERLRERTPAGWAEGRNER